MRLRHHIRVASAGLFSHRELALVLVVLGVGDLYLATRDLVEIAEQVRVVFFRLGRALFIVRGDFLLE